MFMAMRHGSTYDGLVIGGTSDDAFNLHGFMGFIKDINPQNSRISVNRRPELFLPGDSLEFYNINNGASIGDAKVVDIRGNDIFVDKIPDADPDSIIVRYPQYECAGWVIRNSTFYGPYQRLLIQTGPGIFENNICRDVGSPLALHNHFSGLEGGMLYDVKVRNNIFIDCATSPNFETLVLKFVSKSSPIRHKNIEISNNVFLGSGSNAISASETDGLKIKGNIFINPMKATAMLQPGKLSSRQAIRITNSENVRVQNNYLFEQKEIAVADKMTKSKIVNGEANPYQSGNRSYIDPENRMQEYVYRLFKEEHLTLDAEGMYQKIYEFAQQFPETKVRLVR
jgi:hypothetical protein